MIKRLTKVILKKNKKRPKISLKKRTLNSLRYFIGCTGDGVIKHLCMKLPQIIAHVKHLNTFITRSRF